MKILALYDQKENKLKSANYLEVDLDELNKYGNNLHTEEFSEIPSLKIDDKTILEWFSVDNFSYWWFVYQTIYPKFQEVTLFIDRLLSLIEDHLPNLIRLYGIYDKLEIIKQICEIKNISLVVSSRGKSFFSLKTIPKKIVKKIAYKKITKDKTHKRIRCFSDKEFLKKSFSDHTIITIPQLYRRNLLDEKGCIKKQEYILQPILDLLKKSKIPMVCFDVDYTLRGDTKILKERLESEFKWVPIEIFLNQPRSHFVSERIILLEKSINKLLQNNLETIFNYRNILISNYMKKIFKETLYEPYLPIYIQLIDELEKFFKKNKPKVIIQSYETGPYAKALEVVAKKLGIKTVGIQHGVINDQNPDYMHREILDNTHSLGNPIPDRTFVFGEFFKKILTKNGNYPEERVVIIGNPYFYDIEKIKQKLNKKQILNKYRIPDKKIVLIALTYRFFYSKYNPDKFLIDSLTNGLRNHDDIIILVRPHPSDLIDEKNLKNNYKNKNLKISHETLIEDFIISDIVITNYSTVAAEAVFFDKPIIFAKITDDKYMSNSMRGYMIENNIAMYLTIDKIISKIISLEKNQVSNVEKSAKKEFLRYFFNHGNSVDLLNLIYNN